MRSGGRKRGGTYPYISRLRSRTGRSDAGIYSKIKNRILQILIFADFDFCKVVRIQFLIVRIEKLF